MKVSGEERKKERRRKKEECAVIEVSLKPNKNDAVQELSMF